MNVRHRMLSQWDRFAALGCFIVGALALLLGYIGISGEDIVAGQLPYIISGGLVGIFALGAAATLWISADLRDEWRELYLLRTSEERVLANLHGVEVPAGSVEAVPEPLPEVVTLEPATAPMPAVRVARSRRATVPAARAR